jgi:hypothetical protein
MSACKNRSCDSAGRAVFRRDSPHTSLTFAVRPSDSGATAAARTLITAGASKSYCPMVQSTSRGLEGSDTAYVKSELSQIEFAGSIPSIWTERRTYRNNIYIVVTNAGVDGVASLFACSVRPEGHTIRTAIALKRSYKRLSRRMGHQP